MADTSARFALPFLIESQASQELTYNEAIILMDALVHAAVSSVGTPITAPPGSPADGDMHLLGTSCTGSFVGHDSTVAYYKQGWYFITPIEGMRLYSKDTDLLYAYDGSTWNSIAGGLSGTFASPTSITVVNGRVTAIT